MQLAYVFLGYFLGSMLFGYHITGFQIKRHLFCVTDKRYLFSVFIFLLKLFL